MKGYDDSPTFVKKMVDNLIKVEGGYSDNPSDSGGKTKYGITEEVARDYGYKGEMKDLPIETARDIYTIKYYYSIKLDLIKSTAILEEVFDSSVNVGSHRAITWLQRSLNVFNRMQDYYKDITVDGIMGSQTKNALFKFLSLRGIEGEFVLLKALNGMQSTFYIELAERREKDEEFVYGQIKNRITLPCE